MKNTKLSFFIISVFLLLGLAQAATYFDSYRVGFEYEKADSLKIMTYVCEDAQCTSAYPAPGVTYHKGDAIACPTNSEAAFLSCMDSYKLSGDVLNLNDPETISNGASGDVYFFTKYDTNVQYGYISYYYTNDDTYIVRWATTVKSELDECTTSTCINNVNPTFLFLERLENVQAEINEFNVLNTNDPSKPIQINVQADLSATVCSAYQYNNPNLFRPSAPAGFSDYSAQTRIDLTITNNDNGQVLSTGTQTIDIEADSCTREAQFNFTPAANLVDTSVNFRLDTLVTDDQVENPIPDSAQKDLYIYPENLNNTCYLRTYDFALTNDPSASTLTPDITNIFEGEDVYAVFETFAARDEAKTPIPYTIEIRVDGNTIYTQSLSATSTPRRTVVNLTSQFAALGSGTYEVRLISTPVDSNCGTSYPEVDILNINVQQNNLAPVVDLVANPNQGLAPLTTTLSFTATDANGDNLFCSLDFGDGTPAQNFNNCNVESANHVYSNPGTYVATVSAYDGALTSQDSVIITVGQAPPQNRAPTVDLTTNPQSGDAPLSTVLSITANDVDGNTLTCTLNFGDGSQTQTFNNCDLESTNHIYTNVGTYTATVVASDGTLTGTDSVVITVTDGGNNQTNNAPQIVQFVANPDQGVAPLITVFTVNVQDADSDPLTCTLNFGDGQIQTLSSCTTSISHTYTMPGVYTAILTATDGSDTVTRTEVITVTEPANEAPELIIFEVFPQTGDAPLDTVFDVWVEDNDNPEDLMCTLNFGDGFSTTVEDCDDPFIPHTYVNPGNYTATLTATDGVNVLVETLLVEVTTPNSIPDIIEFEANPVFGIAPLEVEFQVEVNDADGDTLNCIVSFQDSSIPASFNPCSDHVFNHTFVNPGVYEVLLLVDDGESIVIRSETIVVEENTAPEVVEFTATPTNGDEPLDVLFNVQAIDSDGDALTCTLNFGDGQSTNVPNCSQNGIAHTYTIAGVYTATLTVTDGEDTTTRTQTITVNSVGPVIERFDIDSTNGLFVPTNLSILFNASHPTVGETITCTLTVNGATQVVPCDGVINLDNFTREGVSTFTFTVTDAQGDTASRTITREFFSEDDLLGKGPQAELIIDEVIKPGQFTFMLNITNESIRKRMVEIMPQIVCGDTVNHLIGPNTMSSGAVSTRYGGVEVTEYHLDTLDFEFTIPKEAQCTFRVTLMDNIGSMLVLEKPVIFSYKMPDTTYSSIRGKATDIISYMAQAVLREHNVGYNSIEFEVQNNDQTTRTLEISVIVAELGISYSETIKLENGETDTVQIPMFVRTGTKNGMYPLRISVYDGDDKQTRYTYLNVKAQE